MKHIFTFLTVLFLLVTQTVKSQIFVTLSKETFPNLNNTGLTYPVNQAFNQSTGSWSAASSGKATLAVMPAYYSPVTNALKICHWGTTGLGASDTYATSPTMDLSNPGCNGGKYDLSFNLFTYNCTAGDNNAYISLQFSNNGGATWNTMWQKTSGQINASYGQNAVKNIWVALPSTYFTANFKYRFCGHMNADNANSFFQFIDEPTIYAYSCTDMLSLGDRVWLDINQNGVKDGSEVGMPGMMVQLSKDNDGDGINDWDFTQQTTTTDATGHYKFTDLSAGIYTVGLLNVASNYRVVAVNSGDPDENGDNNNNAWYQNGDYTYIDGGWITLLPQSEPTNDGDGNNGNLTYDFAIYPLSALPVHSVNLIASLSANEVAVSWNTINEINTASFEVERSLDNSHFVKIGDKNSTAIYGGNASYLFNDDVAAVNTANVYYRIKVIDKDFKFSYSNVAVVRLTQKQTVSVWPNPFVSDIKVTYTAASTADVVVKVTDITGKIIKNQSFKVVKGTNQLVISNFNNLANGIYLVDVFNHSNNIRYTSKIIK